MAYVINPSSVLEVRTVYSLAGQIAMNVRHYIYSGATPIGDGRAVAQQFAEHWLNTQVAVGPGRFAKAWQACGASSGVAIVRGITQWIYPTRYQPYVMTTSIAGALSGSALPPADSARIQLSSELSGRQYVGGISIPGVPKEDATTNGTWSAGVLTALTAMGDALIGVVVASAPLTAGPFGPIIFHKYLTPKYTPISGATVHTNVRTQRRRVVGRGI